MRDDPREWELWWVIIGSCLSSATARETVFAKIKPEDCPYKPLRPVLAALKENDPEQIRAALEGMYHLIGCEFGNGCLNGIVERVKVTADRRREVAALEARLTELWKI